MNVCILDELIKVPGVVTHGRVLILGKGAKEIILLLDGASRKEAVEFCERFCRKSGFATIFEPFTLMEYNEHVDKLRQCLNGENRI